MTTLGRRSTCADDWYRRSGLMYKLPAGKGRWMKYRAKPFLGKVPLSTCTTSTYSKLASAPIVRAHEDGDAAFYCPGFRNMTCRRAFVGGPLIQPTERPESCFLNSRVLRLLRRRARARAPGVKISRSRRAGIERIGGRGGEGGAAAAEPRPRKFMERGGLARIMSTGHCARARPAPRSPE